MSELHEAQSWTKPIVWGIAFGLFQAFSPVAFFWLEPVVVWSLSVVLIAAVYIGLIVVLALGMDATYLHRTIG